MRSSQQGRAPRCAHLLLCSQPWHLLPAVIALLVKDTGAQRSKHEGMKLSHTTAHTAFGTPTTNEYHSAVYFLAGFQLTGKATDY